MCRSRCSLCNTIGLVLGVLVGVGVGLLFNYELLPGLTAVLPILLLTGAVAIVLLLIGLWSTACRSGCAAAACLTQNSGRWLTGALGTFVGALLLLLLPALFGLQLVLAAVTAFFLTYLLVQVVCTVTCIQSTLCD